MPGAGRIGGRVDPADRAQLDRAPVLIAIAAVTSLIGVVQTWLSTTVGQRVMHGLRTAVFTHLQRQSLAFFTRTRGGEVQSRITNDVGGMQSVVTSTATSLASNVTTTDELVDLEVRSQLAGRLLMAPCPSSSPRSRR